MMKRIVCAAVLIGSLLPVAFGQQTNTKRGWQVVLNRASLDLSSTDVKNAQAYENFPESKLNSDSQRVVKGHLDINADYFARHFVWGNELLLDYGKTTLKSYDGEQTTNESADTVMFTSSYTQRLWKNETFLGGFEAGPYGSLAYQTEFNSSDNTPLKKVLRAAAGVKIYEGKYINKFHVAGFAEDDFTYNPSSVKYGWETHLEIQQPLREGVKAVYSAMFRDYLYETRKEPTDLDYIFSAQARLDVNVWGELAVSPFIEYYTAQARAFGKRGQNFYIGVSLSFSHTFMEAQKI